jgi:hypothetical protein
MLVEGIKGKWRRKVPKNKVHTFLTNQQRMCEGFMLAHACCKGLDKPTHIDQNSATAAERGVPRLRRARVWLGF